VSETPVERAFGKNHAGLATPSPDRLPRHLLDLDRGAARGIGEPREGCDGRQIVRSGVRLRDTRVPGLRDAPPGAKQASMPSRRRAKGGLGGERSPWKDRAFAERQRSGNVTDSSAEQSPGVGHSSGGRGVGDGLTGLRSRSWEAIREGRGTRVQRRSHPTQVGGDGSPGDGSAFLLNGTPGRSGLRSRDNDADPTQAGDERSKPGRGGAPGLPGAATSVAGVARQGTRDLASA